jgi:hypothetical protein
MGFLWLLKQFIMSNLPLYLHFAFFLTTLLTLYLLTGAARPSRRELAAIAGWLLLTGGLAAGGFFTDFQAAPPRLLLALLPSLALLLLLFVTPRGRARLDRIDGRKALLVHSVRLPVELTLWGLSHYGAVPLLMTFGDGNLDILPGITAPLVYVARQKGWMGRRAEVAWHLLSLALLFNIVARAILSAPSPFQQLSLDQPNVAVFYFPFVWLPAFVVPAVLLAHGAALRQLLKKEGAKSRRPAAEKALA